MTRKHRQFMRHPTEIPISVWPVEQEALSLQCKQLMNNVSLGGLSFRSEVEWPQDTLIKFRIDAVQPPFEAIGKVVWSTYEKQKCYVGVAFMTQEEAFEARMVEQICQIEEYRKAEAQQGRILSAEEAAAEWIQHYAADFPPLTHYQEEH